MKEGYEVYPVLDAVGGTSLEAHQTALQRIALAGGKLVSWVQLLTELQRDWGRADTIQPVQQIAFDPSSPIAKNLQRPLTVRGVPAP